MPTMRALSITIPIARSSAPATMLGGIPDTICAQLSGCKIIYCVENNIWGEPAVDVYGLQ